MNQKLKLIVEAEEIDGRTHFHISQPNDQKLSMEGFSWLLAGSLALCIRLSENEPKVMEDIMNYLNNEFVSVDAFADAKKIIDNKSS